MSQKRYDVVVAGGGLAGLCAAIELKQTLPDLSILVVEKNRVPFPEAAHKVGESSVEIGSFYLTDTLGLGDLLAHEVPKLGLRLYMSQDGNQRIEHRPEVGLRDFLDVPAYQIDRGQFENALIDRVRSLGIAFESEASLRVDSLAEGEEDHRLEVSRNAERRPVFCRWLLDATGRASLLRKKLGLSRKNRHHVNSAWFRIDHAIEPNDWCNDSSWHGRTNHPRRLGTNHLMGRGYWVWIIPLAHDRTSIGIVADDRHHPFGDLHRFESAFAWLAEHEPQCARMLEPHLEKRMDFRAIKDYAYDSKQVLSAQRWCLLGESGIFLDALYSPGTDFIAIANGLTTQLIAKDMAGESIAELAPAYDRLFLSLSRAFSATFYRQYPVFGTPPVMTTKFVWDLAMYWGGIALVFFRKGVDESGSIGALNETLQGFAFANVSMQAFFRRWSKALPEGGSSPPAFVDYGGIRCLKALNERLLKPPEGTPLIEELRHNLETLDALKCEIFAEAKRQCPGLAGSAPSPTTTHLKQMFDAIRPRVGTPVEEAGGPVPAQANDVPV